ncbi:MAG: redoxin family protein [Devosia sp.]|nr:redoxin family protein [Devosia sp.]
MTTEQAPAKPRNPKFRWIAAGALIVAAVAITATLWLSNAGPSSAIGCDPLPEAAAAIDKVAVGELAAVQPTGKGRSYADLAFEDENGKPVTLKDFGGKTLLVNFWASWCVPCRAEMPALDALAKKFDGPDFMVLPVNLDIGDTGVDKARAFLKQANITTLPLYADPSLKVLDRLKESAVALGLPATLLLDRKACEIGVLQGPAKWDSPDGENVIKALEAVKG